MFSLIWLIASAVAEDLPQGQLGRYRTLTSNSKGLGAIYEFKSAGVVIIRPGAVAPGTYKIEGGQMLLPPLQPGGPPNKQLIDLSQAGRLRLIQGQEISMDLYRVGKAPAGKPTVVGEWVGMKMTDGQNLEMRIFFYADGTSLFLLPFQSQQAKYSVDKNQMKIILPDGRIAEGTFTVNGRKLSIPSVRAGMSTQLARY
jgi:hypothetical protein